MSKLNVNQETVNSQADGLSATAHFKTKSLANTDNESTITANAGGKEAFTASQNAAASLASAIDQESKNIRSLGASFVEFDQMMAAMNRG